MGTLLSFTPRKELKEPSSGNKGGFGSNVTQLITKTLPIDVEKIRGADNGIASFLSKLLLQEGVVNVALDEEELDIHSIMRVLSENGDSWELTLAELIECMREKPASTSHADLKGYLMSILGRVGVKVIFDAYSPDIQFSGIQLMEESNFGVLLDVAVVGQTENGIFNFSIGTYLDPESVTVYPEAFRDPKNIPLFLLAIQYFMGTLEDRYRSYSPDSLIEILHYRDGVMYIIQTTYKKLYTHVMTKIYEYTPRHATLNNDRIAMQQFYNKNVIPLLR